MGYVITNGSKFICVDARNKVDSTKNVHSAKLFDTWIKANNFFSCMPPLYRNAGYDIVEDTVVLEEEEQFQKQGGDIKEHTKRDLPKINEEYLDLDFLLANVQVFEEFMRDLKSQKRAIEIEHAKMDRVISDLVHAAEIYDLVDASILNCENTRSIEGLYHRQYRPREIKNLEELFQGRVMQQTEEEDDEGID